MKTSTKITIGIVAITTTILVFINLFVFFKTQNAFQEGIRQYDTAIMNGQLPDKPYIKPFSKSGTLPPIEQRFYNNLSTALILSAILGIILALFAGGFFSKAITRPLNHLKNGIQNLRNNKTKVLLAKTGEEEFDVVIDEFNTLVNDLNYQEELQNNLISDVAHELKTPITALTGQLQGVKDGVLNLDNKRIDLLLDEMDRLSKLTDSLNDYTKLRSTFPNIKKEEIDLNKFIENIKDTYAPLLSEKGFKIETNIPENTKINADRNLLKRILNNLIDNAIAYSEGNLIKVNFENNTLTVEDNGVGIEKEHQLKVFERFYRVEKSRNRKTGGLGLGLSMVKEIAEAHGWKVRIESEKSGTKFIFNL